MDVVFLIFSILAVAGLIQSLIHSIQVWENVRFVRSSVRPVSPKEAKRRAATGHALLVVPCKGFDVQLEANLEAFFLQDYEDCEIVFVVESVDDPAVAAIRSVMAAHCDRVTRLVVAGIARQEGQKIHNLRAATADIATEVEFIVFADSDAQPRVEWLSCLLSRLSRESHMATTGYRWFLPESNNLAGRVLASINSGIISLLNHRSYGWIWGGSWAILRSEFDSHRIRDAWKGSISDDLIAGRLISDAGHTIRFEPRAVALSPINMTWRDVFSFLQRQYQIIRIHRPVWWLFAVVASLLPLLVLGGSLVGTVAAVVLGGGKWLTAPLVFATVFGWGLFRAWRRLMLIDMLFIDKKESLRRIARVEFYCWPLITFVHLIGTLSGAFSNRIRWRNIEYRVDRRGRVVSLSRLTTDRPVEGITYTKLDEDRVEIGSIPHLTICPQEDLVAAALADEDQTRDTGGAADAGQDSTDRVDSIPIRTNQKVKRKAI